jgi:tRNA pseudouridine38-40 synthase
MARGSLEVRLRSCRIVASSRLGFGDPVRIASVAEDDLEFSETQLDLSSAHVPAVATGSQPMVATGSQPMDIDDLDRRPLDAMTAFEVREALRVPEGWRRLRFDLEFDGTDFAGWQVQAKGERTVQGVLETAFAPLGDCTRPMAAGRTDAGVHALRMTAHVDVRFEIPAIKVLRALNSRLPADVRVLSCTDAAEGFHARFSCAWRSYRYRILNAPTASALHRNRALWVPQRLEVGPMRDAARTLIGRHDFASFATQEERQTVRELFSCSVRSVPTVLGREGQHFIEVQVTGESFLRHMVRGIVGTLIEVGFGKLDSSAIKGVLESRDRAKAGPNVAAHGLFFERAGYEPWSENGLRVRDSSG